LLRAREKRNLRGKELGEANGCSRKTDDWKESVTTSLKADAMERFTSGRKRPPMS